MLYKVSVILIEIFRNRMFVFFHLCLDLPLFWFHLYSGVICIKIIFFHVTTGPDFHAVSDFAAPGSQDEVVDESRGSSSKQWANPKDLKSKEKERRVS